MVRFPLVAHFLGQTGFTSMSKTAPVDPTIIISLSPCWVSSYLWKYLELRLHGIHFHSHMCQFFHDRLVVTGKDCIGLCHSFQFATTHIYSLDVSVQVIDRLVVLFWWGWCYTVYNFFTAAVYPPFPLVVTALLYYWWAWCFMTHNRSEERRGSWK